MVNDCRQFYLYSLSHDCTAVLLPPPVIAWLLVISPMYYVQIFKPIAIPLCSLLSPFQQDLLIKSTLYNKKNLSHKFNTYPHQVEYIPMKLPMSKGLPSCKLRSRKKRISFVDHSRRFPRGTHRYPF